VVIDAPGLYVLSRDWEVSGSEPVPQLSIEADNVVLDFRGFTLDVSNGGLAVTIRGSGVTLRNGRLRADEQALMSSGRATTLERMTISSNSGVLLEGDGATVRDDVYRARFSLHIQANSTIEHSDLGCSQTCVSISGGGNKVLQNRINTFVDAGNAGIVIHGNGNIVAGNTVSASSDADAIFDVMGDNNVLRDNTVAIDVEGFGPPRTLMVVNGSRNVVHGNIALPGITGERSPTGIRFVRDGNFYGDNRIAALVPFDLGATVQTDWGGNVGF
jgi:hypothetical protein